MAKAGSSFPLRAFVTVALLAAAGAGTYFFTARTESAVELTTVKLGRGDLTQAVTATGTIAARTSVDVSSQVSGLITEIGVDYNTPVKTGQLLAKLDPATYRSKLNQAEAQLANTLANCTLVRLNTERTRGLRARSLVSQQDLDQAEAQLAQAEAQLRIQTASVESAKVDLGRCTIYAPIDGIVLDRQAEVGRTVAASLNAPTLFTIVDDLARMEIEAAVAEADIGNVEVNQPVTFTVDAFPGRQFRGTVTQIRNAPKTTSNVVTYATIIEVTNADLKLRPGMTANVSIVVAERRNSLRVPNGALRARLPDDLLESRKVGTPKPPAAAQTAGAEPPRKLSDDEARSARREIMREAGFAPGSGPPAPDVIRKAQELAKARGIELDFTRFGGRGGDRGDRSGASGTGPVTRTVFRLVGADPKTAKIEPVTVKLGITDGIHTEVTDGLNEGDVLATGTVTTAANAPAANNPFAQRNPMGGPGGRR